MSDQPMTPLDAAILRGRNLKKENPAIQPYSPSHHEMYRIILAAVLNLHDKVEELCKKISADQVAISLSSPMVREEQGSGSQLVSKPCATCGKMMENVPPARKYCDECKEARK